MKRIPMLLMIMLCASFGFSQTAEDILDKSSEAMGGKAVSKNLKSMIVQTKNELPQNMVGKMTIYQKGGKLFAEMNVSANGMEMSMKQGCMDGRCFSSDNFMGTREITGQEKDQLMLQLDMASNADWRKMYSGGELTGEEEINGKPAYKLSLKTLADVPTTVWIDKETYFMVRQDMTVKSPMGEMEAQTYFSDYRDVKGAGGLKIPYVANVNVMQMELKTTITNVEVNPEISDDKFVWPAELK